MQKNCSFVAVAFEICTAQRYKFDKQRRKLEGEKESVTYAEDYQSKLTEAKVSDNNYF